MRTHETLQHLRLCLAGSLLLAATVFLAPADAAASGRIQMSPGRMTRLAFTMRANVDYEITVTSENAIVTLVTYPDGNFVAGSGDATFGFIVPHRTTATNVFLIVRGRPGTPDGEADILIRGFQGSNTVYNINGHASFTATTTQSVPSLAAGTRIRTVENNFGVTDTALMVVNSTGQTVAFDDDDGIDKMSFLSLAAACTGGCGIIVGRLAGTGTTTLIWDDTFAAGDSDGDGLSNGFETNVSVTSPVNRDTDFDGISDGYEVYGAVLGDGSNAPVPGAGKNGNLLKFPMYGANPLIKDMFVELDWAPACPGSNTICPAGSFTANKDDLKYTAAEITRAWNGISNATIKTHFDAGIPTTPGDVFDVRFGNWGGANRLADGDVTFTTQNVAGVTITTSVAIPSTLTGPVACDRGGTPGREGLFHHFISISSRPRAPYGACGTALNDGGTLTHELGHNFNLRHGGPANAADPEVNCKVNYGSVMSYPNQFLRSNGVATFATGYSTGTFLNQVANGLAMNEANGLNTVVPSILDAFTAGGSFDRGFQNLASFPMGIDWNMDGQIDTTPVRAPTNWANTSCAAPYMRATWGMGNVTASGFPFGPTFRTLSVADSTTTTATELIFGSPQGIFVGFNDVLNCASQPTDALCHSWTVRSIIPIFNTGINSAVAVAGPFIAFKASEGGHLAVIRQIPPSSTAPALQAYQKATILGGPVIEGDPAAIEINGLVKVYAISGGRLMRWEFDPVLNSWIRQGMPELWEDGTPVQTTGGIAVIHGADQAGGLGVFAAIPNTLGVTAGNPVPIELARLQTTPVTVSLLGGLITINTTVDRWVRFTYFPGFTALPQSVTKPGLAYAPFNVNTPLIGRFYLTFSGQDRTGRVQFTEGNDPRAGATSRRLLWKTNQQTPFTDADNQTRKLFGGIVLARRGPSVVGATAFNGDMSYFPAVDGIYNVTFRDIDETPFIRGNLTCSLSSCD
jgi:hypothetical protein